MDGSDCSLVVEILVLHGSDLSSNLIDDYKWVSYDHEVSACTIGRPIVF